YPPRQDYRKPTPLSSSPSLKQLANLTKTYLNSKLKYTSERYNVLNIKVIIFRKNYSNLGIKGRDNHLAVAFPTALKAILNLTLNTLLIKLIKAAARTPATVTRATLLQHAYKKYRAKKANREKDKISSLAYYTFLINFKGTANSSNNKEPTPNTPNNAINNLPPATFNISLSFFS
ncbi:hypothetical protein CTA1_11212, partial [Colletotrichum tanaceti]